MLLFSDGAGGFVDFTGEATPAPSAAIFRGQRAAADAPGPEPDPVAFVDASITSFLSPSGTELAPLGSGRWICVDAAASGGGNGQSWATAFNTITAAVSAATVPGDVIVVKGGTYREAVTVAKTGTEAAPYRIVRYGSQQPVIAGSEVLTGWTACTDQADALGSPQWANCYKAFVPAGDVIGTTGEDVRDAAGPCLGLMQDQQRLRLAIDAPGFTDSGLTAAQRHKRAFHRKNDAWFYDNTGATVTYGTGTILIESATAFGSRTAASLTHAWAAAHFSNGNNTRMVKITGFDEGTDTATLRNAYGETTYSGLVAVMNSGQDLLEPGYWVFSDTLEGDGTRKVVVYPFDGVDLTSTGTIEYCKRNFAIEMRDSAWVTLYGLNAYGTWGQFDTGKVAPFGANSHADATKTGWVAEECKVSSCTAIEGLAAFNFNVAVKPRVQNCEVFEVDGQAIYVSGRTSGGVMLDTVARISQNKTTTTLETPIRPHGCRKYIVDFNEINDVAATHANGMSVYGPGAQDGKDGLIFGNKTRDVYNVGLTHQENTNQWFICNDIQTPALGAKRGIEDNGTNLVVIDGVKVLDGIIVTMNNTCGPEDTTQGVTNGITAYKTGGTSHVILNNVGHGVHDPLLWSREARGEWADGELALWLEVSNNVSTCDMSPTSDYTTGRSYVAGTAPTYFDNRPAMANNVNNASPAATYLDADAGDYRPVASGPLDGTGLPPASSANSAILFPDVTAWGFAAFDFDRDCDGNPLDWDAPPIGAYVVPA